MGRVGPATRAPDIGAGAGPRVTNASPQRGPHVIRPPPRVLLEANLCVLIDFENIGTGCDKEGLGIFDVRMVMRRLKDKGRILVSRAYADWTRWSRFKQDLVFSGVNMMELTAHGMGAKNRADIALVVDAMEIAYTRDYIDTFVILSGDSDFTPLVMRLKELNKRVIGLGTKGSTSRLIAETCDEFMFYDTLRNEGRLANIVSADSADQGSLTRDEAFELLIETLENQAREDAAPIHASILKTSMKRKAPTFSEVDLGFRTFAIFLELAQERGLVRLLRDDRAGGYRVELPREEKAPPAQSLAPTGEGERRLLGRLAELGCDIGTLADRGWVTDQFVAACQERARRGRTCAVEYLIGDLLRRARNERTSIPPRVVKGILNSLLRSGAFRSPEGDVVKTATTPFQPPESAEALRSRLTVYARAVLAEAGDTLDAATLGDVFGSASAQGQEPAERAPREPAERAAAERGQRDADAREPRRAAPSPDAERSDEPTEPGEGPTRRRRRRRRSGARSDGQDSAPEAGPEPTHPESNASLDASVDALGEDEADYVPHVDDLSALFPPDPPATPREVLFAPAVAAAAHSAADVEPAVEEPAEAPAAKPRARRRPSPKG